MDQKNRTLENAWNEWWRMGERALPPWLQTEIVEHMMRGVFFSGAIAMSSLWADAAMKKNMKAAQELHAELEAYREEVIRTATESELKERRN